MLVVTQALQMVKFNHMINRQHIIHQVHMVQPGGSKQLRWRGSDFGINNLSFQNVL